MAKHAKKQKKERAAGNHAVPSRAVEPRRILIPIDFSEHSKHALNYAISIARQFQSELTLVYVVETAIYPAEFGFGQVAMPGVEMEKEFRERGKRELDKLVQSVIKGAVSARTIVTEGHPANEILAIAKKEEINLIIIATHGHTGVEHLLFGSTTEKVVRKAPCPVLVVR